MSYTGTEIFNIAIAILDELNEAGAVSDTQVREYKNRAPYLLGIWQRERPGILRTVAIARRPVVNLLGAQFCMREHLGEDVVFEAREAARSAVFYVSDQAEVFIEALSGGSWVSVAGFCARDDGAEAAFTGLVSVGAIDAPTKVKCRFGASGRVRIRFSGSYYYLLYNVALFGAVLPSCGRVPEYGEYVKYDMPGDFDDVAEIVEEAPRAGLWHKWENNRDLYVNYEFDGVLKITYDAAPGKITALTQTLEVDEAVATTGAYFLAEWFALSDMNSELAAKCKSKYEERRGQLVKRRALSGQEIRDVYGIGEIR